MHRDGRLRTRAVGDAEEAAQRMRRGGTAENPRHVIRGKRRAGRWGNTTLFVTLRRETRTGDGQRPGSSATSMRFTARGMRKPSRRATRRGGGDDRARSADRAFHARCRKRNDRSRMRRWLVCHANSANQLLIDRRPGFNKRTGVDVKRSARPRAARASPRPRRLEPPPDGPSITRPCDSVSWPSTPHSSPASSTRLAPRPRNPHPRGRFPASLRRPVRFLRAT